MISESLSFWHLYFLDAVSPTTSPFHFYLQSLHEEQSLRRWCLDQKRMENEWQTPWPQWWLKKQTNPPTRPVSWCGKSSAVRISRSGTVSACQSVTVWSWPRPRIAPVWVLVASTELGKNGHIGLWGFDEPILSGRASPTSCHRSHV